MKYVINGSFLTESIMGVQRYAYEILTRVDKMLALEAAVSKEDSEWEQKLRDMDLEILVPDENVPETQRKSNIFKAIKVVHLGSGAGKKWDQVTYAGYLRKNKAKGISLCNSVPLFAKTAAVCVHDIVFKTNPEFFTEKGAWHEIAYRKLLYLKAFHRADKIITCSEFSKEQILDNYKLKNTDISVITNGWQHYDAEDVDESIFEKNIGAFSRGKYYFFLSSLAKNKNLSWILENAGIHPEDTFVLAGSFLGDDSGVEKLPNVKYVGRVTDSEARALYKHCKAFIFPSFYEGFGIPPMEALCMGAPIVISDIPVLREIYKGAAHYINPCDADVELDKLIKEETVPAQTILSDYSWDKSARQLMKVIGELK